MFDEDDAVEVLAGADDLGSGSPGWKSQYFARV